MPPAIRWTALAAFVAACAPSPPPGSTPAPTEGPPTTGHPTTGPSSIPEAPRALAPGSGDPLATPEAPSRAASSLPVSPEPVAPAVPEAPALFDDAGELLGQTKDVPSIEDALFQHRLRLLWRAIVEDDPEIARSLFFPKVAYLKVKAIADPARDWERRLWKLFVRDVHGYHAELGAEPEKARFLRLDFPHGAVKWMKKHKEGNAIGYHRVKRPHLVFSTSTGQERRLEITAMISWRGHWHVVHLHGFK
jgi:hypothetical protein